MGSLIHVRNCYSGIFYSFNSFIHLALLLYTTSLVHVKHHFKDEEYRENDISYHPVGLIWLRERDPQLKIGSEEHSGDTLHTLE